MRLIVLFLAFMLAPFAAQAQESPRISWKLVLETQQPKAGSGVSVALVGTPQRGWHGYWSNPGDAGTPTKVSWNLPTGFAMAPLSYPTPHLIETSGIVNYAYEDTFALLTRMTLPTAADGPITITADIEYLVCSDSMCLPEKARVATSLALGNGAVDPSIKSAFSAWRARQPNRSMPHSTYASESGRLQVSVSMSGEAAGARFFPHSSGIIDQSAPQTAERKGSDIVVSVKAPEGSPKAVSGLLVLANGRGYEIKPKKAAATSPTNSPGEVKAVDADTADRELASVHDRDATSVVPPARTAGTASQITPVVKDTSGRQDQTGWMGLAMAFIGAVIGGIVLNAMPCVFPILSLKVISLAKTGGNEKAARRDALSYMAGAVTTCVGLGAAILVLRSLGHEAGWAFQLQDPRTIAVLMVVSGAIALNLAGLYEMSLPVRISNGGGAFSTGALAAFVATPCTGPFMGAALGAALVLPAPAALMVFAGLGLGIALPFLAVGFVPAIRTRMPRPGAWMNTLKNVMAIPMMLTTLALAWLLGRQAGSDGAVLGMAAATAFGVALWIVGMRQMKGRKAWPLMVPGAAIAFALAFSIHPAALTATTTDSAGNAVLPFTETRLEKLREAGRPVFVYFTADWCVTCKVNERTTLADTKVEDALRKGGVTVLVGDWTNGDPELGRFIMAHGRAGVPLYLWYGPGARTPETLPQILTASILMKRAQQVIRT